MDDVRALLPLSKNRYEGECFCARCDRKKGNRTVENWKKVGLYDYSILLELKFWTTKDLDKQSKVPTSVADSPFSLASASASAAASASASATVPKAVKAE